PSWINYMNNVDLSIGTRLHGNIAPTLAGTPSITIPIDARMRELSEYHNFPRISVEEVKENMKLEDILGKVDLHSVEKNHQRNYDNFISFLEKNEIEHVYNYNSQELQLPFDVKLEKINLKSPVTPITSCKPDEINERLQKSFDIMLQKQEKERNKLKGVIKKKDKAITNIKMKINEKVT